MDHCINSTKVRESQSTDCSSSVLLPGLLLGLAGFALIALLVLSTVGFRKYRSMQHTIRDLQGHRSVVEVFPRRDSPVGPPHPLSPVTFDELLSQPSSELAPLRKPKTTSKLQWKPIQQSVNFRKSDLTLLQLIKAGKEGVFYKARMTRGTCKGHAMFTCKISKEGVTPKRIQTEVSIMRKLVHHKNVLQLLDWNLRDEPYILIMEFVSYGTLRSFLQTHKEQLVTDPEQQSSLTISAYHIALAMEHLRSKMVVHCDLALRNIMVSKFPWDVKVAEFGLARDLTRVRSHRSSRKSNRRERVPLRWYPPEYFRNNYYSFKGDVWAFGILLWEMQSYGTLPYPNIESSEEVVYNVCAGQRNKNPDGCRPEILQLMQDCWLEPYTTRPSFTDIVRILEDVMENDADYVDVEPRILPTGEIDKHEMKDIYTV